MKIIAYLTVVVSLGAAGTWVALSHGDDSANAEEKNLLPVSLEPLQPVTEFTRNRTFSGTIRAKRRTQLAFERAARLRRVLVDEGDSVKAGDPLAELDDRQLRIRIRQTTAELQQQQAVLQELEAGPRKEVIEAAEGNVKSLTADATLREKTKDRAEELFNRGSISAQMRDEASDSYDAAVARRDAAKAQLNELNNGIREEKKDAQRAAVASLQHQLSSLETDLRDSQLIAPFSGTVVRRMVDEGAMVGAQRPVLELLETDSLEAHVGVPVELLGRLNDRVDKNPGERDDYLLLRTRTDEVRGRIRTILPQIDPATRTQTVIISLSQTSAERVVDGQLIKLDFEERVPVAEHYYRVPSEALVAGDNGLWAIYVFVPAGEGSDFAERQNPGRRPPEQGMSQQRDGRGSIQRRDVERLSNTGDDVIVRAMSGTFQGDERIVVSGTHKVVPRQQVRDQTAVSSDSQGAP